jgi:hypothetical protein
MTATAMTPEALALELANLRAQFEGLEREWNDCFTRSDQEALGHIAIRLRACGLRISELERIQTPDPIPGYNDAGGAR